MTDGPFAGTKELIAGYWLWQVKSLQEAIGVIRRSPFRKAEADVEIGRVMEAADFGPSLTAEPCTREAGLREQPASKN